ncbi:hypothetical protein RIF29_40760 [Crotalaria pallida]|uniref:ATPase AAA-type core domain-containing protein n=1 Tax=Crotalaria pallida TaxID=3830 RepID=A0AAN9E574_CROPI
MPKVKRKQNESLIWKGIRAWWDRLHENLIWRPGNGRSVNFWTDKWLPGYERLIDVVVPVIDDDDARVTLNNFVDSNENWNLTMLDHYIPADVRDKITTTIPPEHDGPDDSIAWWLTNDVTLSPMAFVQRLARWRSFPSLRTLTSRSSLSLSVPYLRSASATSTVSRVLSSRIAAGEAPQSFEFSTFPALLAGAFGIGLVETAYADDNNAGNEDVQAIAANERSRIEELLRSKGIRYGSYPRFTVAVKGRKEIEFIKEGSLSLEELDAFVSVLQLAGKKMGQRNTLERKPREENEQVLSEDKSISSLEAMGVRIYGLNEPIGISNGEISWDNIAGYEHQKRVIEDTILLALHSPEVYDDIARGTRHKFESNRPRAVLFEGPPDNFLEDMDYGKLSITEQILGTGKTSCARVIANQAGVPLLYVPLEVVMSEYYGKSERLLGKIDSFAAARDSEMHEATRRILSVLLRQIDGFEQDKKVVVIAATNRKEDLDPALISRFDTMITFGLPDHHNRQEIASKYAKHLSKPELDELAKVTKNMSGRDIRDICLQAERSWASKIIRGQVSKDGEQAKLPPLQEYIVCATNRQEALHSTAEDRKSRSSSRQRTISD